MLRFDSSIGSQWKVRQMWNFENRSMTVELGEVGCVSGMSGIVGNLRGMCRPRGSGSR